MDEATEQSYEAMEAIKTGQENPTIGDKYLPAMNVQTEAEAAECFETCVQHCMSAFGISREQAEANERVAIAFFAFYGFHASEETIKKIGQFFHIEDEFEKLRKSNYLPK